MGQRHDDNAERSPAGPPPTVAPGEDLGDRFFRELADNAPVMIWRSGADKLCDWFNKPWLDFVGRPIEQEVGNGWTENVHADDLDHCLKTYLSAFDARERFSMVYRLRRADGQYRQILDNGAPFYRAGGFAGYFGSCIDVTDRQQAEAHLRQAQKTDALGKLTGGVAHDFNNLLQIIGGNLELLATDLGSAGERTRKRLGTALQAVQRGTKLASQLLAFARRQPLAPKVVNLGRMIHALDDMLRRALGEAIDVKTAIAGGLWNTFVDPTQVETALLNLAINARDAMDGRGKLTIEAANAYLDGDYATRHAEVMPGQYVMIAVTDTGCGMPADIVEQAFDPFFTTKPEGRGTGLGLSMLDGFVKQSGGHIRIDSEPGAGTTVRIYLPRTRRAEELPSATAAPRVDGGTETILLVEDDDDVRATTADLLGDLGYHVLRSNDAEGALAIIDSGAAIDVLFADIVLPGRVPAPELARRAQQTLPRLAVLFTSGYTGDAAVHGGDAEHELIIKPYTREAVGRKLRQILQKAR